MTYQIFPSIKDFTVAAELQANSQEDALANYYHTNTTAPKTAVAYLKED